MVGKGLPGQGLHLLALHRRSCDLLSLMGVSLSVYVSLGSRSVLSRGSGFYGESHEGAGWGQGSVSDDRKSARSLL